MNRYKFREYNSNDVMSELICNNYAMLLVMNRFGIDLGFGEDSIGEVCNNNNVDVDTFLAVVNILINSEKSVVKTDYSKVSLSSLVDYLHNSHSYFLKYKLPSIRHNLIKALDNSDDASVVIVNYFDEYVTEVTNHMMYEENTLFPYINSVINRLPIEKYSVDVYSKHHDKIEMKLTELKNIMIKYYPAKTTNELNSVLYEIFSCERDLASHNGIENSLLVPTIKEFERLQLVNKR